MKRLKITAFATIMLLVVFLIPGCGEAGNGLDGTHAYKDAKDYLLLYEDVINDYEKLVDFRLSPNFESDYNGGGKPVLTKQWTNYMLKHDGVALEKREADYRWHCMLVDMLDYIDEPTKESFGYMFTDLSEDEIPELVWISSDYRILCIFTIVDNQVRLVDSFWPRHSCVVRETGELCILENNGAADNVYKIKRMDSKTGSLVTQVEFGEKQSTYYKTENGQYYSLTEQEYRNIFREYSFAVTDEWRDNR